MNGKTGHLGRNPRQTELIRPAFFAYLQFLRDGGSIFLQQGERDAGFILRDPAQENTLRFSAVPAAPSDAVRWDVTLLWLQEPVASPMPIRARLWPTAGRPACFLDSSHRRGWFVWLLYQRKHRYLFASIFVTAVCAFGACTGWTGGVILYSKNLVAC